MSARLDLRGLRVAGAGRELLAGVDLALEAGQILALVGSSGAGKSLSARACLDLLPAGLRRVGGELEVRLGGQSWRPFGLQGRAAGRAWAELRGPVLGWIPQAARASLDPLSPIGRQLERVGRLPGAPPGRPADWLRRAGLPDAEELLLRHPHELSGGMARRVGIALALARGSRLLLADEPTTGLDPTVAIEVLRALHALRGEGRGLLWITHDLRLAARWADEVAIIDEGRIVERCPSRDLGAARSPVARRLVEATRLSAGGLW